MYNCAWKITDLSKDQTLPTYIHFNPSFHLLVLVKLKDEMVSEIDIEERDGFLNTL